MLVRTLKKSLVSFAIFAGFWAGSLVWASQNRGSVTVDFVLRQLDVAAADFHSLSANVERTKVTVVVNDKSTESGTLLVRGDKMLLDMRSPDPRTVLRTGDNLYIYTPGLKRVEEYNLGKNRSLVDQFLLLGFGTSGRQLAKSYRVAVVGEPVVNDKKTVELELTPKSEKVLQQISKIQIWYEEAAWLPVQQKFFEAGSDDYSIVQYSNLVKNPPIRDSAFKARWPKGTEKIKP